MAAPLIRTIYSVPKTLRILTGSTAGSVPCIFTKYPCIISLVLLDHQPCRSTSFFNKLPAEQIWKGVTSVSNAGRKRGRGKGVGKKIAKNLNRGQVIGVGRANMVWPGLTTAVMKGRELVQQQQLPEDPEREKKLAKLRDTMGVFRSLKLLPTERGWSGTKLPGRSIGPPDAVGEDTFEGFDTKVLENKIVFCMKGNSGRNRRYSVMVVTGNMAGLGGFAVGKGIEGRAALRKAKNRSGQKLMYIERYKEHTVLHNFFTQYGRTKIFVNKVPEGYGLVCHRAIRAICEVLGIKDIYAKVEGSTSLQHIVKAFFLGLLRQKTHAEMAEEKKLHLVEFRAEEGGFPRVVASPSTCRTEDQIRSDEVLDFNQYVLDGRVVLKKKKWPKFYTQLPGWEYHLKKTVFRRNYDKVKLHMMKEYGEIRSFYTDKYPEARPQLWNKLKNKPKEEEEEVQ